MRAQNRPMPRAVATAIALGLSTVISGTAVAEKVSWNVSLWGNPRGWTSGVEYVAKRVEEETGGNFTITIHYGEAISPARENLDGLSIGAFESAFFCASYHPGKNQMMTVLDLPFLPIPDLHVQEAVAEAVFAHPEVRSELAQWNTLPFAIPLIPAYEFLGRGDPPMTLDEWKGRRVRALGGMGEAMRSIGAVPTNVPAPEMYTGMERGTFDAASLPINAHFSFRLHEVSRWRTEGLAIGVASCAWAMSIKHWEQLPAEYRELLTDLKPAKFDHMRAFYDEVDARALAAFEERNLDVVSISPEMREKFIDRAASPVWEGWVSSREAEGRPGREMLDFVLEKASAAAGS